MSLKTTSNPKLGIQLINLPEENILKIFGFLEVKHLGKVALVCSSFARIQQEGSLWSDLFPEILLTPSELSLKERVYHFPIQLGKKSQENQCILYLYERSIVQIDQNPPADICVLAFYRGVPKRSFVAFADGPGHTPAAVIKDKDGIVLGVPDIRSSEQHPLSLAAIQDLRDAENTPTPFHEFTLILTDPDEDEYDYTLGFIPSKTTEARMLLKGQEIHY